MKKYNTMNAVVIGTLRVKMHTVLILTNTPALLNSPHLFSKNKITGILTCKPPCFPWQQHEFLFASLENVAPPNVVSSSRKGFTPTGENSFL